MSERERVSQIAAAVADGEVVDWDHEHSASQDERGKLRALRTIEAVAEAGSPRRWGKLQIIDHLGHGGFADVYRAWDPALERDVALKLPHVRGEFSREMFLTEARRLAKIDHEGVLEVHGAEEHDGRVGMWTDLLEGKDLEQYLEEQGTFSAGEAALIGVQLCSALAAVHCAGLVHRDVKTANVMRREGGKIILTDFSSVVEKARRGHIREDASTYGTPSYMAPEMLEGHNASSASDIYSLGVLLYRLVSGRYPVEAETLEELQEHQRQKKISSLFDVRPDLPSSFVTVVERALSTRPEDRFPTAGEMERALIPLTTSAPLDATAQAPNHRRRGSLPLFVVLALVGLGAIAGLRLLIPTGSFSIEASLFRRSANAEERLVPGSRLDLGDQLFLELEGTKPLHAYVLNEDNQGRRYVLFPLPGLELENPIDPGIRHRIPGRSASIAGTSASDELAWTVTSRGGEETLLVIASREPLEDLERQISDLPRAGSAGAVAIGDERLGSVLRGIGGLSSEPASQHSLDSPSLSTLSAQLMATGARGLEVWEIRLQNPTEGEE